MHKGVVSCDSSTTVHDAARLMSEKGMRSLVVVDFDCALGGIISQSDIVAARLLNTSGRSWDHLTVGEVMTNRVFTVHPDMSLTEAAQVMVDHRIHRVVVAEVDDLCNPVGMLSMGDIMRYVEGDAALAPAAASAAKPAAKKTVAKKTAAKKPAKKKPATR
jgi:CBS domain-containing protein